MTEFELNTEFNFQVGVDVNSGENINLQEDSENNEKSKDCISRHNDILFVEKEENDKPDSYDFTAAKHRAIGDKPITNGILPKNTIGIEDPGDNFNCRGNWLAYNGVSRVVRRHSINGLLKQERSVNSKCTTPRKNKSSEEAAQRCISSFHCSLRLLGLEPQDLGMTNKDHSSFHYSKPVVIEPTFRTRLVKRSFSLENLRNAIQENHNGTQDLLDHKTLCNAVYEEWYFRKQKEALQQKMAEKLKEQNKRELLEKLKREQKLKADENFIKWKELKSKEKEQNEQKKIKNEQAGRTASGMPMGKPNQEEVFLVWKKQKDKLLKQNRSSESEKGNKNNDAERKASAQIAYAFWKKRADEAYREKLQESKRKEEEVEHEKKRKQLEKQQIAESAFRGWQQRKKLELRKKSQENKLEEEQRKDEKLMQEAERLYDAEQAFEDWLHKIEDRRNRKIEILHRKRPSKQRVPWSPGGAICQ